MGLFLLWTVVVSGVVPVVDSSGEWGWSCYGQYWWVSGVVPVVDSSGG